MGKKSSPEEKLAQAASFKAKHLQLTLTAARESVDKLLKANVAYGPKVLKYTKKLILKGTHSLKVRQHRNGSYAQVTEIDALSDASDDDSNGDSSTAKGTAPVLDGSGGLLAGGLGTEKVREGAAAALTLMDHRWVTLRDLPVKHLKAICTAMEPVEMSPFVLKDVCPWGDRHESKDMLVPIIERGCDLDADYPLDRVAFPTVEQLTQCLVEKYYARNRPWKTFVCPFNWLVSGEWCIAQQNQKFAAKSNDNPNLFLILPKAFQKANSAAEIAINTNWSLRKAVAEYGGHTVKLYNNIQEEASADLTQNGSDSDTPDCILVQPETAQQPSPEAAKPFTGKAQKLEADSPIKTQQGSTGASAPGESKGPEAFAALLTNLIGHVSHDPNKLNKLTLGDLIKNAMDTTGSVSGKLQQPCDLPAEAFPQSGQDMNSQEPAASASLPRGPTKSKMAHLSEITFTPPRPLAAGPTPTLQKRPRKSK